MKKAFIILFLLFANNVFGQINLVRNPSFEQYISCPHSFSLTANAKYWSAIVNTSYNLDTNFAYHFSYGTILNLDANCFPTYCNICDNDTLDPSLEATVPNNQHFYHNTRTGNGMMFVIMSGSGWAGAVDEARSYLQGRLYHNLTAGQSYCVTFYVVNVNHSQIGCNHLGAYFDDGTIDTGTQCGEPRTEYTPQIITDSIITDTVNWHMIQGSFTATGTERFITIGNFSDSAHTAVTYFNPGGEPYGAYYLIDDVSVIATNATAYAGPGGITSPTGDSVQIGDTTGYLPCYWYAGTIGSGTWALIDSNTAGFKVHPDSSTKYVMVLDVCGHVTTDTATVVVYPLAVSPLSPKGGPMECEVFPNPAGGQVTVAGATGADITICDMAGREILTKQNATGIERMDISGLENGIYLVRVLDVNTKLLVVKKIIKE